MRYIDGIVKVMRANALTLGCNHEKLAHARQKVNSNMRKVDLEMGLNKKKIKLVYNVKIQNSFNRSS